MVRATGQNEKHGHGMPALLLVPNCAHANCARAAMRCSRIRQNSEPGHDSTPSLTTSATRKWLAHTRPEYCKYVAEQALFIDIAQNYSIEIATSVRMATNTVMRIPHDTADV